MDNFLVKIKEQLFGMTEEEKDAWIISQAKTTSEYRQEDFYKSLCGKKRILYMPELEEIYVFCDKVLNREIVVEYETHYVEFDDMGYYHDDWEQTYHDPFGAFDFIETVFRACHDLVILEEYEEAQKILEQVLYLEFHIVDHAETDDSCADTFFDLKDADRERLLSVDNRQLLQDYILSCQMCLNNKNELARKITDAFEMELFEKYMPSQMFVQSRDDSLISALLVVLEDDLAEMKKKQAESMKKERHYYSCYQHDRTIKRISQMIEDLKVYSTPKEPEQHSFLRGSWKQIKELLKWLSYEKYIDDQFEIEEIWEISEALIKRGRFGEEPWKVKEEILTEIYQNEFYDRFGCYDPMQDLANAICTTREENLKRAAIMAQFDGEIGEKAAKLYRELGEEEKCVAYYEKHLEKKEEAYEVVMSYYKERNPERAKEVAEQALEKCKENQTPFMIYLMEEARKSGDEVRFNKLNLSAHRRRAVDAKKVDKYFS